MKTKHTIIVVIIVAIAIFLAIISNLSCTKNTQSCTVSSSWSNSKTIGRVDGNTSVARFEPTSVVVVYKNQKVGDINSQDPLIIDISDKDFGPLWMPLYKKGSYNITVSVNQTKKINTNTLIGNLTINGDIKIEGTYSFVGTTSTKEANTLIIDKALNTIYTEVKKKIKEIEDDAYLEYNPIQDEN